jgi:hypothetical protein
MNALLQGFLEEALREFKDSMCTESSQKQQRSTVTINNRMRGAELFARFLLDKDHLKTERIVGTLAK